jgi:NADH-quinone oxidoreductase subunit G
MSCPGGCIGGAGQPVYYDEDVKERRQRGIYSADKMMQLHKSQENPYVTKLYTDKIGEVGGHEAHETLHTDYRRRRRIELDDMTLVEGDNSKVKINVCLGTSCFVKGSQTILKKLMNYVGEHGLSDDVNIKASFCMENCDNGPSVTVGGKIMHKCTYSSVVEELERSLSDLKK